MRSNGLVTQFIRKERDMTKVIVATVKSWNLNRYRRWASDGRHETMLIQSPDELTVKRIQEFGPEYVFFPHWSKKIPAAIYERYECVVFHMTDLPFGRGGSPLQNLIVRGIHHTKISAIRVTDGLDAGPVFLKRDLSLEGSAQEIFLRAATIVFGMIDEILDKKPQPVPQEGEVVQFKRRKPRDGCMDETKALEEAFDFIRMLDAEGYPSAFLETEYLRFEFAKASLKTDRLEAAVTIRLRDDT